MLCNALERLAVARKDTRRAGAVRIVVALSPRAMIP